MASPSVDIGVRRTARYSARDPRAPDSQDHTSSTVAAPERSFLAEFCREGESCDVVVVIVGSARATGPLSKEAAAQMSRLACRRPVAKLAKMVTPPRS